MKALSHTECRRSIAHFGTACASLLYVSLDEAALARCARLAIDAAIVGFKAIVRRATTPQDSDLSGRLAVPLCSFERSEER